MTMIKRDEFLTTLLSANMRGDGEHWYIETKAQALHAKRTQALLPFYLVPYPLF